MMINATDQVRSREEVVTKTTAEDVNELMVSDLIWRERFIASAMRQPSFRELLVDRTVKKILE